MAKSYYSLGCGLSRAEAIAGWCYLPFYLVLLSAGIQYAAALLHLSLSALTINIVYFSINLLFVLLVFRNFLLQRFFGSGFWNFVQALILGFVLYYAGTWAIQALEQLLAYIVSALLFTLMHNWQYFGLHPFLSILLSCLPYIPASVALAWVYEKAGTIWAPITLHALINAMSFGLLNL